MTRWKLDSTKLVAAIFLCWMSLAFGGETNWGKWGPDDQIGTLNYITPETIRHALSLVRKGEVYHLALPVEPGQPTGTARDGRIYRYMISTGQASGDAPGFATDQLFTPVHGPTHWDGLAHIYGEGKMYNGFDARMEITSRGASKNGVHHTSTKVVTRGVLVDIARYKGVKYLAGDHIVTPQDIEGAALKQGVSFRQGDVVLIRTGWMDVWREKGKDAFWRSGSPGIGWGVSQWLKEIKAAAVGVDTLNVEIMPCEPEAAQKIGQPKWGMPIHYELIRNQGMMSGDLFYLDEIAAACAKDGVYEFLFVGQPLNIINATGSPVSPLAIK
jgi:kynurenine formamidase